MSGRIRGHYRIDAAGCVQPVTDVNAAMQAYSIPLKLTRDRKFDQHARLMKMAVISISIVTLGVGAIMSLPQWERRMVSEQATRMASFRQAYMRDHPQVWRPTEN